LTAKRDILQFESQYCCGMWYYDIWMEMFVKAVFTLSGAG